jgi:hypothetical protein
MPESLDRFVQFPHPGAEHRPDDASIKRWNPIERKHGRKFLSLDGDWLETSERRTGHVWAWGEWEPESAVLRILSQPSPHHPRYLWEPYFVRKSDYPSLHNTDPFIFDGFYYANCRQSASPGLRQLACGSVILFGSGQGHGWVIDTVLVVADYVDYNATNCSRSLRGKVPDAYFEVTLRPTWDNPANRSQEFRLYRGATFDSPVSGMFSFFPCMPAGDRVGFARPPVTLPDRYFNPKNRLAAKGCAQDAPPHDSSEIKQMWQSLLDQVRGAGLAPGIAARMPPARGHPYLQ